MCDYPAIQEDVVRIARKQYRCLECHEHIEKGEAYHHHKQLDRGEGWFSCRVCFRCWELLSAMSPYRDTFDCWYWGNLREEYLEIREPLTFGGLVPLKWLAEAIEANQYRHKYYGEPLWQSMRSV